MIRKRVSGQEMEQIVCHIMEKKMVTLRSNNLKE